ncbi:hypothetical protein A9P82_01285 [Arachidicoccus ginsenosidimutans]|uniref:hypothetical protein n=1 Tax=Arachidicoccus sp. BS20 TaxID=1850526 RepID=UPI0007F1245C|nr:hypothetical protein [Arachidicoccus sp. BS20]ANI88064.1 hypothetical protein A9P82_01285 [Arachidicoccus sp. BS20]
MKKNTILRNLLFSFCLLIGIQTFAQQDSTATKKLTDKMKTELSLTDKQYSEVYAINQNFISQLQALQSSGGGRFAKLKKMKSIANNRDKQLKQILTSEQYQAFEKNKAANREKMKEAYKARKK